jgi:hypothetical protein
LTSSIERNSAARGRGTASAQGIDGEARYHPFEDFQAIDARQFVDTIFNRRPIHKNRVHFFAQLAKCDGHYHP